MKTKNQLSRELVAYIQRCINFVEYEFDLRMIAKHELREYIDKLLTHNVNEQTKIYLKDIKTNFCSEIEP